MGTTLVRVYHEIFEWNSRFSNHFITSIHLLIVDFGLIGSIEANCNKNCMKINWSSIMHFKNAFQNVCTMSILFRPQCAETCCITQGYYIINNNYLLIWSQIPHVLDIQPDFFPRTKSAIHGFISIWVRSRRCGCLITWFCYQKIAKPGNKTAALMLSSCIDHHEFPFLGP